MHPLPPVVRRAFRPLLGSVLFGATLCAGGYATLAAPRIPDPLLVSRPRPSSPTALPNLLAPAEAARLRRIFEQQARGDLAGAAREAEQLGDSRLLGHVLADRFLQREARPVPGDLLAWLARYGDHPDAAAVQGRLAQLLPRGAAMPDAESGSTEDAGKPEPTPEERDPAAAAVVRNPTLDRALRDRAREGNVAAAQRLLAHTRGLSPAYAALLRAELARALFQQGRDAEAYAIAAEAARAAPVGSAGAAQANFAAGLAAWALERHEAALEHFERTARAETAPALKAAAAFWTARAAVRARRPQLYVSWMLQAAQEPRTFYGLLARRSLGLPSGLAWEGELAGDAEAGAVAETATGWRALALLQIGQRARAEAELRLLHARARSNPVLIRAMLAVANQAKLEGVGAELAAASQSADGRARDAARYPVPQLVPEGGFRMDPALLYAMALTESRFNPAAVSSAGARGIMQLLPSTASYIAGDPDLRGAGVQRLHDPAYSMELGQRYVHHLTGMETVGNNLVRVLAAYNAGPGNLQRWLPTSGHRSDPFLFIEAIPVDETRTYVQRVLATSWIYAFRLDLPAPTLDQMVSGEFPRFASPAEVEAMLQVRARRLH